MKKVYQTPSFSIVRLDAMPLLSGSTQAFNLDLIEDEITDEDEVL